VTPDGTAAVQLLQLSESAHARPLESLARLEEAGTPLRVSLTLGLDEAHHGHIDPSERGIGRSVHRSSPCLGTRA
jgi:hypothetical protein